MALATLVTPPSIGLTTLAQVKAELGILDSSGDSILAPMIQRASSAIARECGRPFFGVGTYQETLRGSGSQILPLWCVPILSVAQVIQDTDVLPPFDPGNPDDNSYLIEDAEAGALYNAAGWGQTVALQSWGWEAYASQYILPGGTTLLRYTVTYTAGWILPNDPAPTPPTPFAGHWTTGGMPTLPGIQTDVTVTITSGALQINQIALIDTGASQEVVALIDVTGPVNGAYTCSFVTTLPHNLSVPLTASTVPTAPLLPGSVEQACLETVKYWWFNRARNLAFGSMRSEEQAVTYAPQSLVETTLPAVALGYLRNYRRVN